MTPEGIVTVSVRKEVPLAPLTSMGVGGVARFLVDAASEDEVREALLVARREGLCWLVIGGGTNIVIGDDGIDGLVIRMTGGTVEFGESTVVAGAGVDLMKVVDGAAARGLAGMECLAGVPGTLGGAIRGNAGAFGAVMEDMVETVTAMEVATLQVRTLTRQECRFGYRSSVFKENRGLIVLSARLALTPGNPAEIRARTEETLRRRGGVHQQEKSAGSFFVNPQVPEGPLVRNFEEERKIVCRNCRIPAGWLIEQAGLRGRQVGGAKVSDTHGNYLINTGTASAGDLKALATLVKARVRELFGVELEEEVEYLDCNTGELPRIPPLP